MKVIIAGSRNITPKQFYNSIKFFPDEWDVTEVVSGTARGVDRMGEVLAQSQDIAIKRFPADWDEYGKRAGMIRNGEMAKYADALFAVWDGKSKGTKQMIDNANKKGLSVIVVCINSNGNSHILMEKHNE